MLYAESKNYLISKLKESGLKSKPYTSQKALEKSQESHVGAVLFETEGLSRNHSKTYYKDQEGVSKKRVQVFSRKLTFSVVIGGYTDDEVETMFEEFLKHLDRGIYVDGNFVSIEVEEADWVTKDDSILKAQVAVQVKITFDGGLYKDSKPRKLWKIDVEVEKKNERKEKSNGS